MNILKLILTLSLLLILAARVNSLTSGSPALAMNNPAPRYVASSQCAPLLPPTGSTVSVSTVTQLQNAVNSAVSGTTILIADGTYNLEANWGGATQLTGSLPSGTNTFTANVAYPGGILYFALKSQNAEGVRSSLSNNAFWPRREVSLPLVKR